MVKSKQELIYEATLSLIEDNYQLTQIKVGDIAKKANIGKGTIYEYFDSKEEVISEAIAYMIKGWVQELEDILEENEGFEKSFRSILRNIFPMMEKKQQIFMGFLMLSKSSENSVDSLHKLMEKNNEDIQKKLLHLYEKIVDKSLEEGIINEKPDLFDWYFAVNSAIMCVLIYEDQFANQKVFSRNVEYSQEEIVEKAYGTFVKLLG
ncbi:TetR/AcrR family transcriptional regulator [Isachenkonia alkalipeptolytica]|uniref:TetR/AcrR family transcriptional regulator n=1 Tax=Isachenkonia alkalipeptolytica TaxID=2565777 RepID=A0AA43XKM9_9CLOT|nr:TetR/AcrR family transcriptional regulator [Isachenkonia alkalipeptolytica]NBG88568.1 TetR/AcrR family transcriptional regulator [Isachenkonia alkalipeptolytica]